jgi:uncharacterized protein YndB with AHSA1/START domain
MTIPSVQWKLHLRSAPDHIFALFSTDAGRCAFWSETSLESENTMTLSFLGEPHPIACHILERTPPHRFVFQYWAGTTVEVSLCPDERGGTDLTVTETGFLTAAHREENLAGWVTVLMNLKAVADHGIDLRNHDPERTWKAGYCET